MVRQERTMVRVLLSLLAVLVIAGPAIATTFNVGDDYGWTLPSAANGNIDYNAWAAAHQFFVGDVLHFQYAVGAHTVQPLPDKQSFASCDLSTATTAAFTDGSTDITLKVNGTRWYVCSVGNHCQKGMKFKINVASASGNKSSNQSSAASPTVIRRCSLAFFATVVLLALLV